MMLVGIKVRSTTSSTFLEFSSTKIVVAAQGTRAGIDAGSSSQGGQACKAGQNYQGQIRQVEGLCEPNTVDIAVATRDGCRNGVKTQARLMQLSRS